MKQEANEFLFAVYKVNRAFSSNKKKTPKKYAISQNEDGSKKLYIETKRDLISEINHILGVSRDDIKSLTEYGDSGGFK